MNYCNTFLDSLGYFFADCFLLLLCILVQCKLGKFHHFSVRQVYVVNVEVFFCSNYYVK